MPKLFDNALFTISPQMLVGIWGELLEAYHGVNGYAGHTAEIYAYRLMRYSPASHGPNPIPNQELAEEIIANATNALGAIIDEFCTRYECEAEIDGLPWEEWHKNHTMGQEVYDHRAHVKIVRKVNP